MEVQQNEARFNNEDMSSCTNIVNQMDMKVYNDGETSYSSRMEAQSNSANDLQQDFFDMNCRESDLFSNILEYQEEENSEPTLSDRIYIGANEQLENQNGLNGPTRLQSFVLTTKDIINSEMKCMNNDNKSSTRYSLRKRKTIKAKDFYTLKNSSGSKINKALTADKKFLNFQSSSKKFINNSKSNDHINDTVMCPFCSLAFSEKDIFDTHVKTCQMLIHKGTESVDSDCHKCQRCFKVFKTSSKLQYHLCFEDKMSLKCEKCNKIFSVKQELELHNSEKQCRNMEVFTCDTCKRIFSDFGILKRHIMAHLENPLQCLDCSKCFDSDVLFKNHSCHSKARNGAELNKETPYSVKDGMGLKCDTCNELFLSQNLQDEHVCNSSLKLQTCTFCHKKFSNFNHYKKHLKTHKDGMKSCKNCNRKFPNELKLMEHLGDCVKIKKHKYECDTCRKKFRRLSKLQIHVLNIHHGVTYDCDKCYVKFISQEELDAHQSKDCKPEEPCSCKMCGKLFAKKDYLKKHEYIHSNILYRCKFCHCAFMREKSYKKHVEGMNCSKSARKIRLDEFNYKKCRICDTDFETEELLIEHFGVTHTGQNPHQCFCCDSCLPTFKDLKNHIHLHNVQKYTCNLCGKPYTSQEGFRKHRLKHKGAEFKCEFCDSEFLNERRFKFHVKTCKKNPGSAYHVSEDKERRNKKDSKPKQSRQLHWESRIIMKRLRGDPNSISRTNADQSRDNIMNFFDEPDSNDSNVRGWFDDYYKTEEDDFAFGLKKDYANNKSSETGFQEPSKDRSVIQKEKAYDSSSIVDQKTSVSKEKDKTNEGESSSESSSSSSSDSSSEAEFTDDLELPLDYNPKKCRICLVTFSQEYELLHHFIKLHANKKAHKCPNCEVECPLFAQLKEHMKTHGIGIGIYNCINCSKKFRSEKKMKNHNVHCKGGETYSFGSAKKCAQAKDSEDYCKHCHKKFQTKCGYRRHKLICKERRKSNKENKKNQESPLVLNTLDQSDGMSTAISPTTEKSNGESTAPLQPKTNISDTNSSNTKDSLPEKNVKDPFVGDPPMDSFPCRLCDRKFQYERGIVMHFKSEHPGHKPLVCHICNMHLADKLKEHLKTHGIGEEFICELCGKRFNQKFLSKIHEMWHQGIEYKCGNCKQKFLNKEKMDKHINENRCSNRQSLMRLPCDICGKSYRSKFGLGKHYITHTPKELRPVKNRMNCEFCGKWFETNNGLQRHRRIHTGERPFCCRFCSKSFVQEGNCKSHERIHTGESRPRKKKRAPSETLAYVADINSCLYNGLNSTGADQSTIATN